MPVPFLEFLTRLPSRGTSPAAGEFPAPGMLRTGAAGSRRSARRLAVLASLLLPTAAVQAQAGATGTGDYLRRMDANGDGRVALVEYQDWMSYAFDRMDANADGVLQPAELPGSRGKTITRRQYRQRIALTFARQDANGDGFLDARELAAPPR